MRQNEQNRNAANRLGAALKRKKEENTIGFKRIENQNEQLEKRIATNRLGAALKRKKEENTIGFKKIENENEQLEKRIATNRLGAALKRKKEENTIGFKKIENENDQLMEILQKPKNQAASKLQDAIRRKLPLTTSTQQLQNSMLTQMKKQRNDAAMGIQRLFRESKARKIIKNKIRQDNVKKGSEIVERMKQDQYNTYLQDEAASNYGVLSRGVVKQQKKALQDQLKQVQGHQLLKDIKKDNTAVNFEFMTGDALRQQRKGIKQQIKQNQETRDKQMEAAIKKYNKIGDMMATRNDSPMVLGETAPSRFIQSASRLRKKALQSEISHVDSRVLLATKQQKEARIQKANLGIKRMDNIIKKKSEAGRPRTRSDQETAAQSSPASRRSSRLSMLSTSSTLGSFTPKKL
jgi:hypothetical protein